MYFSSLRRKKRVVCFLSPEKRLQLLKDKILKDDIYLYVKNKYKGYSFNCPYRIVIKSCSGIVICYQLLLTRDFCIFFAKYISTQETILEEFDIDFFQKTVIKFDWKILQDSHTPQQDKENLIIYIY